MTPKITAILLLILLNILSSCTSEKKPEPKENEFEKLNLQPMTLVIDEVSCKHCVYDMAEVYAKNDKLNKVVFLTADPFGQTLINLDSTVNKYPRRDFIHAANTMGSFLINQHGDTIKLDVTNYKEVLGGLAE